MSTTRQRGCTELAEPLGTCVAACADEPYERCGRWRTLGRVVKLLGVALLLPLLLLVAGRAGRRSSAVLCATARITLRAVGVRMDVVGAPRSGPSLVVANHVSWLDILVMSAAAPMRPVAKSEVGEWAVVGTAARRFGAIFLRRGVGRELPATMSRVTDGLRRGQRVQLFPEATTRCGTGLDEFYRAGFQAAIDAAVVVQPVSLKYVGRDGHTCVAAAFVGDETLGASLRRVLRMGSLRVGLRWLPVIPAPVTSTVPGTDRRRVAARAQRVIARDLALPLVHRRPVALLPISASIPIQRVAGTAAAAAVTVPVPAVPRQSSH